MKAADVMTRRVVTVRPDTTIEAAARLMLEHHISGLPVLDGHGALVGIVSEGDLLRRVETGTERRRPRWIEFLIGPGRLSRDYVHAHGRRVDEVMTPEVVTAAPETPLEAVVTLMERHGIKRLPVVAGNRLVGIVSRANLLHLLARLAPEAPPADASDGAIRERVLEAFARESWAPRDCVDPVVRHGVVDLWGVITDERQRQALRVAAENVPGVRAVRDHLTWVEPLSGMVVEPPG
jgi:CBS domain-containing protein